MAPSTSRRTVTARYVRVPVAQQLLGVSRGRVYQLVHARPPKLASVRNAAGRLYIERRSIEARIKWLASVVAEPQP